MIEQPIILYTDGGSTDSISHLRECLNSVTNNRIKERTSKDEVLDSKEKTIFIWTIINRNRTSRQHIELIVKNLNQKGYNIIVLILSEALCSPWPTGDNIYGQDVIMHARIESKKSEKRDKYGNDIYDDEFAEGEEKNLKNNLTKAINKFGVGSLVKEPSSTLKIEEPKKIEQSTTTVQMEEKKSYLNEQEFKKYIDTLIIPLQTRITDLENEVKLLKEKRDKIN